MFWLALIVSPARSPARVVIVFLDRAVRRNVAMEICNCLECVELGNDTHRREREENGNPRKDETSSEAE